MLKNQDNRTPFEEQNRGGTSGGQAKGQTASKSSLRGFAAMDRARQREIASIGGRAAHEKGTAHEFTSEEAREAGRKGGQASGASRSAAKLRGPDQGGGA